MANPVLPRRSFTPNAVPLAATEISAPGELVINWADGVAYTKDSAGNLISWSLGAASSGGGGGSFTWASVPAASGSAGTAGDLSYDSTYLYVRTANLWKRVALSTWGGDSDFASVKLLLHFDGTGASFTDFSSAARTVTAYGNATQSATESKFGGKSLYCDGTGDYVAVPSSADFDWSVGDAVIEGWIRLADMSKTRHLCGTTSGNSDSKTGILVESNGTIAISLVGTNSLSSSSGVILLNTWHHFACVKSGSSAYIYVDGTRVASGTASQGWSSGAAQFSIGRTYQTGSGDGDWQGNVDDLRVTVGSNRGYTSASIAVPTAAYLDY